MCLKNNEDYRENTGILLKMYEINYNQSSTFKIFNNSKKTHLALELSSSASVSETMFNKQEHKDCVVGK